jgi:hypothetical protein
MILWPQSRRKEEIQRRGLAVGRQRGQGAQDDDSGGAGGAQEGPVAAWIHRFTEAGEIVTRA